MLFSNPQKELGKWIDQVLSSTDFADVVAFNFNLYEGEDDFHLQLIGSDIDPNNDADLACSEIFSTGEKLFRIKRSIAGSEWQDGLAYFRREITKYLESGKFRSVLLAKGKIGLGFVDGDIEFLGGKET